MSSHSKRKITPATPPTPKRPVLTLQQRPNGMTAPSASPQMLPNGARPPSQLPPPNISSPHTVSSAAAPLASSGARWNATANNTQPLARAVVHQSSNPNDHQPLPARPVMKGPGTAAEGAEVKLFARNLPPDWDTLSIYRSLQQYGVITRIDIQTPRRTDLTNAWISFVSPAQFTELLRGGMNLRASGNGAERHVEFVVQYEQKPLRHRSPINPNRDFAERIKVKAMEIKFGVMRAEDVLLELHTAKSSLRAPVILEMNLQRNVLDIDFAITADLRANSEHARPAKIEDRYKMRLSFAQITEIMQMNNTTGQKAWVLSTPYPPLMFQKTVHVEYTHEPGATLWNEWQTWYRETEIDQNPDGRSAAETQLQKETAIIDIGRWLSYALIFDKATVASPSFRELCQALHDYNIPIKMDKAIKFDSNKSQRTRNWLDNPPTILDSSEASTIPSELHQLAGETTLLHFNVRYQLEVCISHGVLHESNITKEFLARLAAMENERAARLLEKAAEEKTRFYSPENIFRRLQHKVSFRHKSVPAYCAMIRAATVTPTMIYFTSPALETSNRVVRKYQHYVDRFLRVKFTDERYKGRIMSCSDASMDQVYARVKNTMKNGIKVGDRHYEFLAFGNSQFREHGAWFFAPTSDLTVQQMRDNMGHFSHIKTVAKYCSRIGQCFSTTRSTRWSVNVEKIPDIQRNGYCFTDGIGKISPFLAKLIAQELGYPCSGENFPSAFQFRHEGCKGVLVVDKSLSSHTIQIRPSQEKFAGAQHRGLEIVRISQFSTAYLNVQLILVLSALGVGDGVFVHMMRQMLADLKEAMDNEKKALELLQKNVDYNHMTIQLASIIHDGFMETQDPFTISCLRLWRSWSLKYLKEKSRIYVEKGAFVLGCVDETATLRGHFDTTDSLGNDQHDPATLPQIFLQIDLSGDGKTTIIRGVCSLARNPSLHPEDIRVVMAVDKPELRHIKNCVVLPQTGDRDLANMCSGGDLDGDDYIVMWDEDLLPKKWNHPPMDYTPPSPVQSKEDVTADDMSSCLVTHMKQDTLGAIAVAHKYHADASADGVKDPTCKLLAGLHSTAVDFAKTGVPAEMGKHLRVTRWPHWAEVKGKSKNKIYHSKKIIGQLYDEVDRVPFRPAWELPFDQRIIKAYELDEGTLGAAKDVKQQYDEAVRRIMAKFGIKSEFEVCSTFVLEHHDDLGDYKFAETIGEEAHALKDSHQKICYTVAGTTDKERDWSKMGPFIAAMYAVTANEVEDAIQVGNKPTMRGGQEVPFREPTIDNMPFMSFPWLFPAELGRIANKREDRRLGLSHTLPVARFQPAKKTAHQLLGTDTILEELTEVQYDKKAENALQLPQRTDLPLSRRSSEDLCTQVNTITPTQPAQQAVPTSVEPVQPSNLATSLAAGDSSSTEAAKADSLITTGAGATVEDGQVGDEGGSDNDGDADVEEVTLDLKPSALDALDKFMGSSVASMG